MDFSFLEYLFGGLIYLASAKFRDKKKKLWLKQSQMYKIYEIGMWISIPFFSVLVVAVVLAQ